MVSPCILLVLSFHGGHGGFMLLVHGGHGGFVLFVHGGHGFVMLLVAVVGRAAHELETPGQDEGLAEADDQGGDVHPSGLAEAVNGFDDALVFHRLVLPWQAVMFVWSGRLLSDDGSDSRQFLDFIVGPAGVGPGG